MHYQIRHETLYDYGSDVTHAHHMLHLVPRPTPWQQCLEHVVHVSPEVFRRHNALDAFGNPVTRIEIDRPHRQLDVISEMQVEVRARPVLRISDSLPWETCRGDLAYDGRWPSNESFEARRFRHESPHVRVKQMFTDYSADCFAPRRPILECADELMTRLHRDMEYAPGSTDTKTSATEVLGRRRGVCQDFSHLMIACLRSRGLAARYVSGYVRSRRENAPGARPGLLGGDASHAWVAVYSPPFGWVELDPTNRCHVGIDHVAIAWGRDFGDVSPLRGVILGGGAHTVTVRVHLEAAAAA
jgi:transglutaminase-like putative cysteine protease